MDRARHDQARVNGGIQLGIRQRDRTGRSRQRVCVAIECVVVALILRREDESGGCDKYHLVVPRDQAGKRVQTTRVCHRRGEQVAAGIAQLDRDARDAGFTRILNPVSVQVIPDEIAKFAGSVVTEIDVATIFVVHQHKFRDVRRRDAVQIVRRCRVDWRQAGDLGPVVRPRTDRAPRQTAEQVQAVRIGNRRVGEIVPGRRQISVRTARRQRDLGSRNPRFARILDSIAINVVPDEIADGRRSAIAEVGIQSGHPQRQVDQQRIRRRGQAHPVQDRRGQALPRSRNRRADW